MADITAPSAPKRERSSLLTNPRTRSLLIQGFLFVAVAVAFWFFIANGRSNLAARNIATGFGFLGQSSGFDISQSLIPYDDTATYGRVFFVGLLNTLLVSAIGVVLATIIGFLVGIARLSKNWLLARLAEVYVEVIRNLPLLFQILFWYLGVLAAMPPARQSFSVFGFAFVNNRGLVLARPVFNPGSGAVVIAFIGGIILALAVRWWAHRRQMETGQPFPTVKTALALIIGLPLVTFFATGAPISIEWPELRGFNFNGGIRVIPEFAALLIALSTYTAAFIAEIVRAGILAVSRGQTEAAESLGLRTGDTLRLVVIPQAMRVIIPPLTSQYLNLTKNSSLAVAIGYPDFFALFAGTTLNQTGQAIEIIAMTMAVYLAISLITSALMNIYNRRMALVER
jgi:general L-amino acid transport system permease protein